MRKILISLVLAAGVLAAVTPAQSQQPATVCPPGQSGNLPYGQSLPPGSDKLAAKLTIRAPPSAAPPARSSPRADHELASRRLKITLQAWPDHVLHRADRQRSRPHQGRPRHLQVPGRSGTGIITITYEVTRHASQVVHSVPQQPSEPADEPADVTSSGFLRARAARAGKRRHPRAAQASTAATADGHARRAATINPEGGWSLNAPLSASLRAQIAARYGTVHSYTLSRATSRSASAAR